MVYMVKEGSEEFDEKLKKGSVLDNSKPLKEYLMDNFSKEERKNFKTPKYFYEVEFEKPGGLVMPLIVQYKYKDGSVENIKYPAQIWRKNDKSVKKVISSNKELVKVTVDPKFETADIDTSNNTWPKESQASQFDKFKDKFKN